MSTALTTRLPSVASANEQTGREASRWRGWSHAVANWPRPALAALLVGCANGRVADSAGHDPGRFTPDLPTFITGPIGLSLTNARGYSARMIVERREGSSQVHIVSGDLLVRGAWLLFQPARHGSDSGAHGSAAISYIWNVGDACGYAVNEPLQGYAPITASNQVVRAAFHAAESGHAKQRIEGRVCHCEELVVAMNDNTTHALTVWRADQLPHVAVKVQPASNAVGLVIHLSAIRSVVPDRVLFDPAQNFTRYPSFQVMQDEWLRRQSTSRKAQPEPKPRLEEDPLDHHLH